MVSGSTSIATIPRDMVVKAESMDAFAIAMHLGRLRSMREVIDTHREALINIRTKTDRDDNDLHTTTFDDPAMIIETSTITNVRGVPQRRIRIYGSPDMYGADYVETETQDRHDVLRPGSIDDAVSLCDRMIGMLSIAHPAREKSPHGADQEIIRSFAAYIAFNGIPIPTRTVSIWTGRPYGTAEVRMRDRQGDFHDMPHIDPQELTGWLPPCASFSMHGDNVFGMTNVKFDPGDVEWDMDPMHVLRTARKGEDDCSG